MNPYTWAYDPQIVQAFEYALLFIASTFLGFALRDIFTHGRRNP